MLVVDFMFTGRELVFVDAELVFTGGEYKISKGTKVFLIG
jgi:hypothetical protein